MFVIGQAEEFRTQGIAVNGVWCEVRNDDVKLNTIAWVSSQPSQSFTGKFVLDIANGTAPLTASSRNDFVQRSGWEPRGARHITDPTAPCYDDEGAEYPSDESEDNLMNPLADGKGVVLITGGLGGLGIVTAEAVVEAGAPCVVLASRSGKVKYSDQGLDERLEALRACGAKVVLERCDTSIEADVEATLKRVRKHGPLRVVVHAAGTLSDGLLPAQDSTSVQKVWGPKADGAWFLHKHTANNDQCLGAFIVYSSVSSLFGGVGQANYSAANAYLDELVRWRVDRGLTGMSAQWPSVLGVGMAAAMDDRFKEDVKLSISVHTVKQVVTQMLDMAPTITASAVQAVVPRGLLEKGVLPDAVALLLESVQVCLVTRCGFASVIFASEKCADTARKMSF